MATPASATAFSTAVRRVVVTPTFAAGLGVVIAAAMAYPMTKTVISTPSPAAKVCVTTTRRTAVLKEVAVAGVAMGRPGRSGS